MSVLIVADSGIQSDCIVVRECAVYIIETAIHSCYISIAALRVTERNETKERTKRCVAQCGMLPR